MGKFTPVVTSPCWLNTVSLGLVVCTRVASYMHSVPYTHFQGLVKAILLVRAEKRIDPKCMGPSQSGESCWSGSWQALRLPLFPVSLAGLLYVCLSVCLRSQLDLTFIVQEGSASNYVKLVSCRWGPTRGCHPNPCLRGDSAAEQMLPWLRTCS